MEIERPDDQVVVLRLRGGKANAMSPQLLERLLELLAEVEGSGARAVVVTGDGRHFSGGLALPALAPLDRAAMSAFIDLFARAMERVLRLPIPVVAAVNGHAIAGGCVLALEADARLMAAGEAKIGLNETQVGIGLPAVVVEPLRLKLRPEAWLPVALEGRLFTPAEAQAVGLVDEVVPAAELEARAVARARTLAGAPPAGFAQVKAALLRPALEALTRHGEAERERWLDTWFSEPATRRRAEIVARLAR